MQPEYEKPEVADYGDLTEMTQAAGTIGAEDGVGKTVVVIVPEVGGVSVGILP